MQNQEITVLRLLTLQSVKHIAAEEIGSLLPLLFIIVSKASKAFSPRETSRCTNHKLIPFVIKQTFLLDLVHLEPSHHVGT